MHPRMIFILPVLVIVFGALGFYLPLWSIEHAKQEAAKAQQAKERPHYKGCINNLFLPPEEIKKRCKETT